MSEQNEIPEKADVKWPLHNATVCPQCGYCPCCGRPRGNWNYPQYPYYPNNPVMPTYQVWSGGTVTNTQPPTIPCVNT